MPSSILAPRQEIDCKKADADGKGELPVESEWGTQQNPDCSGPSYQREVYGVGRVPDARKGNYKKLEELPQPGDDSYRDCRRERYPQGDT